MFILHLFLYSKSVGVTLWRLKLEAEAVVELSRKNCDKSVSGTRQNPELGGSVGRIAIGQF